MGKSTSSSEEIKSDSASQQINQFTVIHSSQAYEFLQIYKDFENLMMQPYSKKCYALSKEWFDKFKQFGESLKSFDEQIKQSKVNIQHYQPNLKQIQLGSWGSNSNIEIPAQYPGPIMNFHLLDVQQPYLGELYSLDMNHPQQWSEQFQDWSFMKLKNDIEINKDFVLVSQIIWQKLIRYFGGAPEIGYYLVDRKHFAQQDPSDSDNKDRISSSNATDLQIQQQTKEIPDLNPIIVKVNCIDGIHKNLKGILVSKHIGVKNFLNSISAMLNFAPTKVSLFKAWVDRSINQIRYEQIQNKGASTLRLIDHQIDDIERDEIDGDIKYKLFILQTEGNSMSPQCKLDLIQALKIQLKCNSILMENNFTEESQEKFFDQESDAKEVKRMYSPQKNQRRNGQFGLNLLSANEFQQVKRTNPDIPEEYANDPDLYYAIQASLGVFEEKNELNQDNLTAWDNYNTNQQNFNVSINGVNNRKTPSTDEEMSVKNNQSLDLGEFDIDDTDDNFNFMDRANNERNNYNNTPKIYVSALEDEGKKTAHQGNENNSKGNSIPNKTLQQTRQEKMKIIREQKKDQFLELSHRARREVKGQGIFSNSFGNNLSYSTQVMGHMGPIKSFGELKDSILKLRENFDAIVLGKIQIIDNSPLKKKDLLNEFENGEDTALGCGSLKEQECETDEEEEGEKKEKIKERTNSNFSQMIA